MHRSALFRLVILSVLVWICASQLQDEETFYDTLLTKPLQKLYEVGVTPQAEKEIVREHNNYRLMLAKGMVKNQPKAANMLRMRYDKRLARYAQYIANTFRFAHVKVTFPNVVKAGQNLYTMSSTDKRPGANWTHAIKMLWDEHWIYNYEFGVYPTTNKTGHYTQIIWADSYLVGCGYTYCQDPTGWNTKLYVCNYGPPGNVIGQIPYEVGPGCDNLCEPEV